MRGQVDTPEKLVDHMVEALFKGETPTRHDRLLDAGCGTGAFIAGVLRWCDKNRREAPHITGVDSDPRRIESAQEKFSGIDKLDLVHADYLEYSAPEKYRFVVGNPPYVGLPQLSVEEREHYRNRFVTAVGRFDLYFLFFEKALSQLQEGGRLAFVTPEKWLYVRSAYSLRNLLAGLKIDSIELLPEGAFPNRATYPCVTVLRNRAAKGRVPCRPRSGPSLKIPNERLGEAPWWSLLQGGDNSSIEGAPVLSDITRRISAGVATGADRVFIKRAADLPEGLKPFAFPTLAGRDLNTNGVDDPTANPADVMLVPYGSDGKLQPLSRLGGLARYLRRNGHREILEARTCAKRKPWYAFHDSLPLHDLRRPKLLCKDITSDPRFWVDREGRILPRHSVYYIVPSSSSDLDMLADWLNSGPVRKRLRMRCQRAQNGSLRLQAEALRTLSAHDAPAKLLAKVAA